MMSRKRLAWKTKGCSDEETEVAKVIQGKQGLEDKAADVGTEVENGCGHKGGEVKDEVNGKV